MRLAHRAQILQRGADVQHRSAVRLQVRQRRTGHVKGAFQVDVHHGREPVRREVFGAADEIAGGAVHHDIEPAQLGNRRRDHALDCRRIANVGRSRDRAPAGRAQLRNRRLEMFQAAARDRDVAPVCGEREGDPAADAGAAAGHERDMSFQQIRLKRHSFPFAAIIR